MCVVRAIVRNKLIIKNEKKFICKRTAVSFLSLFLVGNSFADIDVSADIKMYGILDQAMVSQKLTTPNSGAEASYSGVAAVSATSRLGFKGIRELSDGIKGMFQIEIQLDADTSTLLPNKNRTAFVALQSESVGTVQLGTIETAGYEAYGTDVNARVEYKPNVWRTVSSLDLQDRTNNSIKYITPSMAGFELHLQQSFAERASTESVTASTSNSFAELKSIAFKYKSDKWKASVVHDETKNALMGYKFAGLSNAGISTTSTTDGLLYYGSPTAASAANSLKAIQTPIQRDFVTLNYDFGKFAMNYLYAKSYQSGTYAASNTTHTLGIKVPFDKLAIGVSTGKGVIDSYSATAVASDSSTTAPAGRAKDGNIFDTTVGIFYNFDKSTLVYLIGSDSASSVGVKDGKSQTIAIGARYNF